MIGRTDIDVLREIAVGQLGYFTAKQADEAGVGRSSLSMMLKRGRLEKACRGVYRVLPVEPSVYDRYMVALLWTGCEEAALSHMTALDSYGVCDVEPRAIDILVGASRRIRKSDGEGYFVHRRDLPSDAFCWWEGMRRVKLTYAITQCCEAGVSGHVLSQAVDNGLARGLMTRADAERLRTGIDGRNEG